MRLYPSPTPYTSETLDQLTFLSTNKLRPRFIPAVVPRQPFDFTQQEDGGEAEGEGEGEGEEEGAGEGGEGDVVDGSSAGTVSGKKRPAALTEAEAGEEGMGVGNGGDEAGKRARG